jgi:hypothetical protein
VEIGDGHAFAQEFGVEADAEVAARHLALEASISGTMTPSVVPGGIEQRITTT